MTRRDAAKVVAVLLAAYPNTRVTDQTSVVYEDALMDLDYELVDRAVRALILTEPEHMPRIAKIRQRAIEYRDGRKLDGGDAWGAVRRAAGRFGRDREREALAFLEPISARVIASMGWVDYCNSSIEDIPSWRAKFIELYNALSSTDEHDRKLAGVLAPPVTRRQLAASSMRQLMQATALDTSDDDPDLEPWEK